MTELTTTQAGASNSASLRSYSEIARTLGLRHCADGSDSRHRIGYTELGYNHDGCVHWNERRPTKRGIRNFLKLATLLTLPRETRNGERWARLYWQNNEADRLAAIIGIRLPRRLADPDRAKVRFWLAQRIDKQPTELTRRIQRWLRP